MLPVAHNSRLQCNTSHGASVASRMLYTDGVANSRGPSSCLLAASLATALTHSRVARGGSRVIGHGQLWTLKAAVNDLVQQPLGEQLLWPNGVITDADLNISSTSTNLSGGVSTNLNAGISSALSTEALRPRRFSAPVIARLLRSTTNLQALADVVQQQSPYMDIPLVTLALLHLALLFSRGAQQKQQQQQLPAREAPPSSSSNNNSHGNENGMAAASSLRPVAPSDLSPLSLDFGNDRFPLQMSSLLDDDGDYVTEKGSVGSGLLTGGILTAGGSKDDGLEKWTAGGDIAAVIAMVAAEPSDLREMATAFSPISEAGPQQTSSPAEREGGSEDTGLRLLEAGLGVNGSDGVPSSNQTSFGSITSGSDSGARVSTSNVAGGTAPLSPPPASPATAALRVLVPLVLADLDGVSGFDLSKMISALAILRYDNKVVVEQLLQVLSLKLVECSSQELANVLVSLAMLGVPPDPLLRSNIYSTVKYQIRRFAPRDLALTLWAYGAMGTDIQEDAVLVLLEASKPKLGAFSPLHLAKAAQGLAALRYRPSPDWVSAFSDALRPALRRTASQELCAVLLALADLQVTLDDTTRATLLVHTLTSLPFLESPELALSIWALGRLTAGGLPALVDLDTSARVLEVTLSRLREGAFSGGELQQLLEGLTRLSLQPPLEWMQAYVAALKPKLATLEARQLSGVLGSLAAQQYRPEPEMQRVVMAATQDNMRQLLSDTTAAASLITALRRLNIEPPAAWVAALLEASRSALKNRSTDLHLATMAGALAAWGVRPDGRWAARLIWRSQVLMQQGRMSPRALVALLQAMSALGLRPNPVWTQMCLRTAASRSSDPDFEPQHFSTLLPALHALEIQPPQEWLSRMMLSMYRCWERFSVIHWSSMLPALVLLRAKPHREWLQRLEDVLAPRLADCSALQLLALLVSTTQLRRLGLEAGEEAGLAAASNAGISTTSVTETSSTTTTTTATTGSATNTAAATVPTRDLESQGSHTDSVAVTMVAERPQVPMRQNVGMGMLTDVQQPDVYSAPASASASTMEELKAEASTSDSDPAAAAFSSDTLLLSLNRLRNLNTARWRQRRLARLAEAEAVPSAAWMAVWWAASVSLLVRVRYAPSELLLTASWLVSLGMRPPSEWLEACIEVSQRYSKVMSPAEQMQLAAAVLPLAGRRANIVATTHSRRTRPIPARVVAAASSPGAGSLESLESVERFDSTAAAVGTAAAKRRRRWRHGKGPAPRPESIPESGGSCFGLRTESEPS